MKIVIRLLAALALMAAGVAQAATTVAFVSDPGDYIGGGQTQTFTEPQWRFSAGGSNSHLSLAFNNGSTYWNIDVSAPQALAKGRYGGAARYPFNSPRGPGLSVSGDGRGCNTLSGWFEVLEFATDSSGTPIRAAINFRQACEGGSSALYGALRINSSIPADVPVLRAVTGREQEYLAGDSAYLDGGGSFDRDASTLKTYRWVQTAGTPVVLDDPSNPYPLFTVPVVPSGGETLRFALTYSDSHGNTDTDVEQALVHAPGDAVSYVRFSGSIGDYITGGRSYNFNPTNSTLGFARNFDNGVQVSINGDSFWTLNFAAPNKAPLTVGTYSGTMRFPFQDAGSPGLDVSGDGRGCNTSTGSFTVLEASYNPVDGTPLRLDIQFEQHCEGAIPKLTGELKYNSNAPGPLPPPPPPEGLVVDAGPDITVRRAQLVHLDGSGSHEDGDSIASYHWTQVAGPKAHLFKADTVKPKFLAPLLVKKSVLRFRLVVVDSHGRSGSDTVQVTVGTQQ